MKCFTKRLSQNRDKCTHGGHSWINLDQQSIIRLSHVWNYHAKGMILKLVGKLIVKCSSKCVLFLKGSCCNIPSVFKKKKNVSQHFVDHVCPHLTPLPIILIHLISPTSLLSFGRLSLFFLSFSLFSFYWNTHTHPPASTPKHTISPSFFLQDHRKNT